MTKQSVRYDIVYKDGVPLTYRDGQLYSGRVTFWKDEDPEKALEDAIKAGVVVMI